MLNNSTPLPFSTNLVKFQTEKDTLTFNNKTPYKYEVKNTHSSDNSNPKYSDNDIIPRIIKTNLKEDYNNIQFDTPNQNTNKKGNENISNNYSSLKGNNSLFNNLEQNESPEIREKIISFSPGVNSGKMSISELNNINKDNLYDENEKYNYSDNNYININEGEENEIYDENLQNLDKNDLKVENEEKMLEDFLCENNNKNVISQKENEFVLFDMNNTINNDNINKFNFNVNEILNSDNNYNNDNDDNKRNFFSKILDIEILVDTNEIYSKPWSKLMNNIYKKFESKNDSIQLISFGAQHTLCISNKGKLFSFGWNNYSQCGKKPKKNNNDNNDLKNNLDIEKIEEVNEIKIGKKINDISAGEDHSLIVTDEGKIFGFGLNSSGQLCYNPYKHKIINKPSLIKSFKKFNIINMQCTDNISFVLNNKGEAFICPWEDKNNNFHYTPIKLYFPYKPKIVSISCGDNFSIFLSERGNVYSMGSNNKYGQLGLGNTVIQLSPNIISFFKNNKIKISQISCGYCHVLALSEKGNVYSWGYGGEGQLGLGNDISISYIPKIIDYFNENEIIIFQISSGFHSSYFLTENNSVYICGTNGRDCNKEFIPKIVDVKMKYKDLVKSPCWICRILNCWNRSMSVFYAIFLDCHFINKDDEEVNKILNLISKKWVHQSFSSSIMEGIYSMNCI